jgi:hypothetical protein
MPDNAPPVGRQFAGQRHFAITTPEEEQKRHAAYEQYGKREDAVSLDVYFAASNITNPVIKAAMRAYTHIRYAPMDAWVTIFKDY